MKKTTRTVSDKTAKRTARENISSSRVTFSRGVVDLLSINSRPQNKSPSTATEHPPPAPANQSDPGLSNPQETLQTIESPVETQAPHSAVQGSPVDTQAGSLSSRRQTTNQTTGSGHRGPRQAQLLPYPIQSSSTLSTKLRIAEGMGKGPAPLGQSKYKGLRMQKNANPSGESRSPVISSTTSPRSPFELSQGMLLRHASNERTSQAPIRKSSLQQHSPPPPQPEEPSHDMEVGHMDVDQPEFVCSLYYCFFHLHRSAPLLLPDRRILQQRTICYKR